MPFIISLDLLKYTDTSSNSILISYDGYNCPINDLIYANNVIDGLATAMNQVQDKNSKSLLLFSSSPSYSLCSQSTSDITAL